jgi:hypothetical protein
LYICSAKEGEEKKHGKKLPPFLDTKKSFVYLCDVRDI